MSRSLCYRIRVVRPGAKDLYLINAMSPERALTSDAKMAQHFQSEGAADRFRHGIVTPATGQGHFFTRLKPLIFSYESAGEPVEKAELHIEYAQTLPDGRLGTWVLNQRGGLILRNPLVVALA